MKEVKKPCRWCGGTSWGLLRKYYMGHQFCRKKCLEAYKKASIEEIKARLRWLAWLGKTW